MASITGPSHLINPLATPAHLETSATQLDGIPKDLEDSVRYETTRLLEASGILLRLPQEIIAQSIVLLARFWSGADGASMLDCDAKVCLPNEAKHPQEQPLTPSQDTAAAALYLSAKPSATPITPRSLLTVLEFTSSLSPHYAKASTDDATHLHADWSLSAWLKRQVKEAVKAIDRYEEALADEARRRGFDGVVCGHIHHADMRQVGGVLYVNDGDWVESCTALVEHHDGRLELLDWAAINNLSFFAPSSAVVARAA